MKLNTVCEVNGDVVRVTFGLTTNEPMPLLSAVLNLGWNKNELKFIGPPFLRTVNTKEGWEGSTGAIVMSFPIAAEGMNPDEGKLQWFLAGPATWKLINGVKQYTAKMVTDIPWPICVLEFKKLIDCVPSLSVLPKSMVRGPILGVSYQMIDVEDIQLVEPLPKIINPFSDCIYLLHLFVDRLSDKEEYSDLVKAAERIL